MAETDYSTEEWRDIPGFEGCYQASSLGRVRSVERIVKTRNRWGECDHTVKEKICKGRLSRDGYRRIHLSKNGVATERFAHSLVLEAFVGPCPSDCDQVAHGNGDRLDNRPSNLRWTNPAGNTQDKVRHGSTANQFGERHSQNKLTEEMVREIRATPHTYGSDVALARKFGVRPQAIGKVRRRERWPHVH